MTRSDPDVLVEIDPYDVRLVQRAAGLLGAFNTAGVLSAADVHVALRLARLGPDGSADGEILLAVALAVRGPRLGHVCTDLSEIGANVVVDADFPVDVSQLPWPDPQSWVAQVAASPLVAAGARIGDGASAGERPLRLVGTLLYLDRYWREERAVAADLRDRADKVATGVDRAVLATGLDRLFGRPDARNAASDYQRLAAASAVLRRLTVVGGGPGTGKTTTVAKIIALLEEQASRAGAPPPLVALAAPTAKAAARLSEAVHEQAAKLDDIDEAIRDRLAATDAVTLHRLLGWRPGSRTRFRHDRHNHLPHDVVIVDETSMVSLSLMARLVESVRADARLILVGDPEQLVSVEAGAVLGDVVGPAAGTLLMRAPARTLLAEATGAEVPAADPPAGSGIGDGIVILRQVYRFNREIAALAEAIRQGDADAAMDVLRAGAGNVTWLPVDVGEPSALPALEPVRRLALAAGRRVTEAARAGHGLDALAALATFRLLCAHRRGPYGVASWTERVEHWLSAGVPDFAAGGAWYVGQPLLVTENDYGLQLYNGDSGVVVGEPGGRVTAVFERAGKEVRISPTRLSSVDTVYAMTVHKSQGSQFDKVAVLLPDPSSRILTRELLYTAVTRARERLLLAGTEASVRAAVDRPVARASGLRDLLWSGGFLQE